MKYRPLPFLGAVLPAVLLLSACGGSSGPSAEADGTCGPQNVVMRPGSFNNGSLGAEGDGTGAGGGGGDAGGNGGDAGGAEGQFRYAQVEVRNRKMEVVATGRTDYRDGMVNVMTRGCPREPIEIAFIGGEGVEYYDEVTGRFETYGPERRVRVRVSDFSRNVSANTYTEAAARLMDAENGGQTRELKPEQIDRVNERVGLVAQDQLPGVFRPQGGSDGGGSARGHRSKAVGGVLDITRIVRPINKESLSEAGSFGDTANGRFGAVLAGLGSLGDLAGEVERPASRINQMVSADLADGKLDLHGIVAGASSTTPQPLIGLRTAANGQREVTEPIPYNYETLWRAKTTSAGSVALSAGDATMQSNTRSTAVANYSATSRSVYRVRSSQPRPNEAADFLTGSAGTQTVKLYADGRLTLTRSMAAGFSAAAWWNTFGEVEEIEPLSSQAFTDVKVGSLGEVIALDSERKRLAYIRPFTLYRVTGNEDPSNGDANRALLRQANRRVETVSVALPAGRERYRILGFVPGPERRAYPGRGKPPAMLMLLTDGSLWGVDPDQPGAPFQVPVPEPLLQVAFDKFVSPTYADPAYGSGSGLTPAGTPGNNGHRRLYGLTTRGTVRTWIEGLAAEGRELTIPGRVILLSGESKTNVYALTSDGDAYWLNADQALAVDDQRLIDPPGSIGGYPRRYALNQVLKVDLGGQRACWMARSEAVICDSGEVRLWEERVNPISFAQVYGALPDEQILMPNDIRPSTPVVAGGSWRINAADEDFLLTASTSRVSVGGTYLQVEGPPLDSGAAQGKRNLHTDAPVGVIHGRNLVAGLKQAFAAGSPFLRAVILNSTTAWDGRIHDLAIEPRAISANRFDIGMQHAIRGQGGAIEVDPYLPNLNLALEVSQGGDTFSLKPLQVSGGDPVTTPPNNDLSGTDGPTTLSANVDYPINEWLGDWRINHVNPVHAGGPQLYVRLILRDVTSDPYAFRLCFDISYQVRTAGANNSSNGISLCTVHEGDGRFRDLVAAGSYSLYDARGQLADDVLHDIDWGSQIYSPY